MPPSATSSRTFLLPGALWAAAIVLSLIRLYHVTSDPDRDLNPVITVLIIAFFAAAVALTAVQVLRTRRRP